MKSEQGSSLVVAMILLGIITVVAVYSLEGSNIQKKMLNGSLFSALTYQECRNEQEAQIRYYNNGNTKDLLSIAEEDHVLIDGELSPPALPSDKIKIFTKENSGDKVKSAIDLSWKYIKKGHKNGSGFESTDVIQNFLYENDCAASYRFSKNSQTQGVLIETLRSPHNIKEK